MENHSIYWETFPLFIYLLDTWDNKQQWAPEYLQGIYKNPAAMIGFIFPTFLHLL